MQSKFFSFLKYEEKLLTEMLQLSEKHQQALINYDTQLLETVVKRQSVISKSIHDAEEKRMGILMSWLKVSRTRASEITMTELAKLYHGPERQLILKQKNKLKDLLDKIHGFNTLNRVLANKAISSVREILSIVTNGTNQVCNVKV